MSEKFAIMNIFPGKAKKRNLNTKPKTETIILAIFSRPVNVSALITFRWWLW